MPRNLYRTPALATDDQGPDEPADPLDGLQALLSGKTQFPAASMSNLGDRNSAIAGSIRKAYGLGPDDGSMSQSDLEALDSFVRGRNVNDKVTEEVAPVQAQGANAMGVTAQAGRNALAVENAKGQYGLQDEAMKGAAARDIANIKEGPLGSGGSSSDNSMIDYWAQQAQGDSSLLAKLPAQMKEAVAARMAQNGGTVQTLSNQTRQMSEAANDLLPMIDSIQSRAQSLKDKNAFDLVNSPLRQMFVKHGAGSLLGYMHADPSLADDAGRFQTDLGLLQSGVARAHAGARGAGNSDMAARFEKLMNAQGDLPTFLGQLQGVRDLLSIYAKHTNPNVGASAADPYADPNYQPR